MREKKHNLGIDQGVYKNEVMKEGRHILQEELKSYILSCFSKHKQTVIEGG